MQYEARSFGIDALRCDDCGGRYRRVAEIRDRQVAAAILRWLGLPDTPLPITQARPPPHEVLGRDHPGDPDDCDQGEIDWAA